MFVWSSLMTSKLYLDFDKTIGFRDIPYYNLSISFRDIVLQLILSMIKYDHIT